MLLISICSLKSKNIIEVANNLNFAQVRADALPTDAYSTYEGKLPLRIIRFIINVGIKNQMVGDVEVLK